MSLVFKWLLRRVKRPEEQSSELGNLGTAGTDTHKPNNCRSSKLLNLQHTRKVRKVKVAVVDSGADAEHPEIKGKVVAQKNFITGGFAAKDDDEGHGTHIAGIVARGMKSLEDAVDNNICSMLIAKVSDESTEGGYGAAVAESIRWSVDSGAEVINVSLAGPDSTELKSAVDHAANSSVLIVAAAGNQGVSAPTYPAAYPNVLAVAAINDSDQLSCNSNFGAWVDLAAPGENVASAVPGGGYRRHSGTSQASAQIAALAANLLALGYSVEEIRSRMKGRPWIPEHLASVIGELH